MSLIRPALAMALTLFGAVFHATQAGTLMVSGNDAKAARIGGGYKVDADPPPTRWWCWTPRRFRSRSWAR